MKKGLNYSILLVMTILMVGCTTVEEDVPVTNAETITASQEASIANKN